MESVRKVRSREFGVKSFRFLKNHESPTRVENYGEELFEEGIGLAFFRKGVHYI